MNGCISVFTYNYIGKKELYGRMLRNQEKLDEQMREKYSVEKLFDNANATVVKSEDDLEKEYFTKPRAFQRYSQYTTQNEDIQDYTIKNSTLKKNELFNFFNQYGKQGIKINIGFK